MAATAKDQLIRELKDMLHDQQEMNRTLQKALESSNAQVAEMTVQIRLLNEQLDYMKHKLFGTSREKTDTVISGQLSLFGDEAADDPDKVLAAEKTEVKSHTRRKKKTLDEKIRDLPVETVEIALGEEEMTCPQCGTRLEVIGRETVRREIEYIPATLKVKEYVQLRYGCPECKNTDEPYFAQAQVPAGLMKHSPASPSTVAWVMYQKFANGLPLYRQEKDWLQMKFELSRTTMANWIIYCAENYFRPLYDHLHALLVRRQFAMADESPVQVLKEEGREAAAKSYMWLFRSGEDGTEPIVLYKYAPTRSGDVAREFLEGFEGYLMVDGYTGYNKVPGIRRCCCFAHIRRYFYDAIPKGKTGDMSLPAVQGVMYCDKLFEYERHFKQKGYSPAQIKNGRLKKEKPVIEAFLSWLKQQKPVPKSKFDTAVTYALNRQDEMMTYLEDGRCSLSNNLSEQKMKSYVIGRKGWLFCDTPAGADAAAVTYSLVETARSHDLNVFEYIKYILEQRPSKDMTEEQLEALMPWNQNIVEVCSLKNESKRV